MRLKGYGMKRTDSGSIPGALVAEHCVQETRDSVSDRDGIGEEDLNRACGWGVGERRMRCCSVKEGRKQLSKPET